MVGRRRGKNNGRVHVFFSWVHQKVLSLKCEENLIRENLIVNDKNAHLQVAHGPILCSFYFYFSIPVMENVCFLCKWAYTLLFLFLFFNSSYSKCLLFFFFSLNVASSFFFFSFFFFFWFRCNFLFQDVIFIFLINVGDCIFLVVCHIFVLIEHRF